MRIVCAVVFIFTVILSSCELSTQFECLPNGAPISVVPRGGFSSSSLETQQPAASSPSPARPQSALRSPPNDPPKRARSRSPTASYIDPPTRLPSSEGNGYELDQLEFIRLTSTKNPHQLFKFQRYTFPADKTIRVLAGFNVYRPMPPQERIVLSTVDGDVFAILTSNDTLAGIYKYNPRTKCIKRAKISKETGRITILTPDEIEETPVGPFRPVQNNFRIEHINHRDGPASRDEPSLPATVRSRPALPFTNVLGYRLDQLHFIRLRSNENPHRLFEFRRYTFPANMPIKIRVEQHRFRPISIYEQIVLSTFSGDVFAIFESSYVLAGIYGEKLLSRSPSRAKMNIESGVITSLTTDEIRETPVGSNRPIKSHYAVEFLNQNPPHY